MFSIFHKIAKSRNKHERLSWRTFCVTVVLSNLERETSANDLLYSSLRLILADYAKQSWKHENICAAYVSVVWRKKKKANRRKTWLYQYWFQFINRIFRLILWAKIYLFVNMIYKPSIQFDITMKCYTYNHLLVGSC